LAETIRIGTRGSRLALAQTEIVRRALGARHGGAAFELVRISTKGDKILDVALAKIGGKGLFTKEIEDRLLAGEIDMAVHSLKDLPTDLPEGLSVGAVLERDEPRDALVSREGFPFRRLPERAVVGTSSLRRKAQLLIRRPDLRVVDLRGNVETRLRKLRSEGLDAIVLACAGLRRLGLEDEVTELLDPEIMLPPAGQGAIAVEIREGNDRVARLLDSVDHRSTRVAVEAERSLLHSLGGGCQVPIGTLAHAVGQDARASMRLRLMGLVATPDGTKWVRDALEGPAEEAQALGRRLAERLVRAGAEEILQGVLGGGREDEAIK
jgi:hydroxymethylbilane synthase